MLNPWMQPGRPPRSSTYICARRPTPSRANWWTGRTSWQCASVWGEQSKGHGRDWGPRSSKPKLIATTGTASATNGPTALATRSSFGGSVILLSCLPGACGRRPISWRRKSRKSARRPASASKSPTSSPRTAPCRRPPRFTISSTSIPTQGSLPRLSESRRNCARKFARLRRRRGRPSWRRRQTIPRRRCPVSIPARRRRSRRNRAIVSSLTARRCGKPTSRR